MGWRVIVEVVPRGEPHSRWGYVGKQWALLVFLRWDSFALGVQNLKAGVAVHVGPIMFGLVRVQQFLERDEALAKQEPR